MRLSIGIALLMQIIFVLHMLPKVDSEDDNQVADETQEDDEIDDNCGNVKEDPENALCTTTEGKTECDCDDDVDCADDNNNKICDCQEYRDACPKMCGCIDKWSTV